MFKRKYRRLFPKTLSIKNVIAPYNSKPARRLKSDAQDNKKSDFVRRYISETSVELNKLTDFSANNPDLHYLLLEAGQILKTTTNAIGNNVLRFEKFNIAIFYIYQTSMTISVIFSSHSKKFFFKTNRMDQKKFPVFTATYHQKNNFFFDEIKILYSFNNYLHAGLSVYIVEEGTGEMYLLTRQQLIIIPSHYRFQIEDGKTIAAHVAFHREYVMVEDIKEDPRFSKGTGFHSKYPSQTTNFFIVSSLSTLIRVR